MSYTLFHKHKCPSPPSTHTNVLHHLPHTYTHTQKKLPFTQNSKHHFPDKTPTTPPRKNGQSKVTDQVPGQVGAGTPAGGAEAETPGAAFGVIGTQVERAIGALVTAGTLHVTLKHKLE